MRVTDANKFIQYSKIYPKKSLYIKGQPLFGGGGAANFNFHNAINYAANNAVLSPDAPVIFPNNENLQAHFLPLNFTSSKRVARKDVPIVRFDESIRCPCCGERMATFDKTKAKKLAIKISMKSGQDLTNILKENICEFQPNKRALVREIARLASKHPDKRFSDLLELLSEKYINTLRMKQIMVTMELANELPHLRPRKTAKIKEWQAEQIQRILDANTEGEFKNKYLITSFIETAHINNIRIDEEKIRSYFGKLPNSKNSAEAYVVKYKRRASKEAVYKIIKNTEPTIEHIIPFSESGDNKARNLLVMCSDCNTIRGDISYDDFIQAHPEMLQNIKKYFADIKRVLRDKKNELTPEQKEMYANYINDVKTTLERYSPDNFCFE